MPGYEDVVRLARADLGYTECVGVGSGCTRRPPAPGGNHTVYGVRFGLNGFPWCSIYTWDLWTRAGYGHLIPKTAGAWNMLDQADAKGWALPPQMPRVGDVPVYGFGDGHIGGVVTGVRSGGFTAVEGNTSRGNKGSQVNGWYVAERFRTVSQLRGLIRLPIDQEAAMNVPTADEIADAVLSKLAGWTPPGTPNSERMPNGTPLNWQTVVGREYSNTAEILKRLTIGAPVTLSQAQIDALADAVAAKLKPPPLTVTNTVISKGDIRAALADVLRSVPPAT